MFEEGCQEMDRFICERCGVRFTAPGQCAGCEAKLMDLADPGVQSWLESIDRSRNHQHVISQWALAPVLAAPVPLLLLWSEQGTHPGLAWMVAAALLGLLLGKLFPAPRIFPHLTDDEQRAFRGLYVRDRDGGSLGR